MEPNRREFLFSAVAAITAPVVQHLLPVDTDPERFRRKVPFPVTNKIDELLKDYQWPSSHWISWCFLPGNRAGFMVQRYQGARWAKMHSPPETGPVHAIVRRYLPGNSYIILTD